MQNFQKVYYDDDDGSFQSVLTHNIKKRNLALVTFNVHFSNGTKQSFRTILTYIHTYIKYKSEPHVKKGTSRSINGASLLTQRRL